MISSVQVSFILHRTRSMDNLGSVARIVKNFGLGRLWLVDPLSYSFERAAKLAVGAEDVLEQLYVERDLTTALRGFAFTVGTSSRAIRGRISLSPREAAARITAAGGKCAVVFGDEKRGLSDEELALCQEVCRIPSAEAQPSLNLAQACAVMGFAIAERTEAGQPESPSATQEQLWGLRERLRAVLEPAEFLNPQSPDLILTELMRAWERARLAPRELELWGNALRKIGHTLDRLDRELVQKGENGQ
jgi:tRNA/rRNA methyltransferase